MRLVRRRKLLAGRYEILEELGSGGTGTVYRAKDVRSKGEVALKLLHPFLRNEHKYTRQLKYEAEVSMLLNTPEVVRMLAHGRDGEDSFLVMEYVRGRSLFELLQQRVRLETEEALTIALDVARALEEAHNRNIIHCDIKPQNILVCEDGHAKVADFGIAKAAALTGFTTKSLVGSVHYMAPEALNGKPTASSDIYSLGVVLYEMLTGKLPLAGETPYEIIRAHMEQTPASIPGILFGQQLEQLVASSLAKAPERRPITAGAFATAVRRLLAEEGPGEVAVQGLLRPTGPNDFPGLLYGGALDLGPVPPSTAAPNTPATRSLLRLIGTGLIVAAVPAIVAAAFFLSGEHLGSERGLARSEPTMVPSIPASAATLPPLRPVPTPLPSAQMTVFLTVRRNDVAVGGIRVTATVNGLECATVITTSGATTMQFPAVDAPTACRQAGATVRFVIDGQQVAAPTLTYVSQATFPIELNVPVGIGSQVFNTPDCRDARGFLYCVYTVKAGDNLATIAAAFGFTGRDKAVLLAWSNRPDIVSLDDLLQIGQMLRIPAKQNSVIHTVLKSQTLEEIAAEYGVRTDEVLSANGSANVPAVPGIGKELLILNPKSLGVVDVDLSDIRPIVRSAAGFSWPVSGPISSYFGPEHPGGIDIDLGNANPPIAASAVGTVVFAGGEECCGVGLFVLLDHGNGLQTLYGQLSRIDVIEGQAVKQGQTVGLGGRTGYATGNNLHFEVHLNGMTVNPLDYLP